MNVISLTDALKPGADCWGEGPPGLSGFAWPGADDDPPECASCGLALEVGALPAADGVLFCASCEERSHLGDLAEIYVELGGGD
jgi:hypothetical protein